MNPSSNPATGDQARSTSYAWDYDSAGRLVAEVIDHWDSAADRSEAFVMDLVGNRMSRSVDYASPSAVDQFFSYDYDANDRLLVESRDDSHTGAGIDQTTTYGYNHTQQTSKVVTRGIGFQPVSSQLFAYDLQGRMSQVITETHTGGSPTSRSRVDYQYNAQGIRITATESSYDYQTSSFELQTSTEYLIDQANFTGYAQTVVETTKNAAGQVTKRISYTFGQDEITQTTSDIDPATGEVTSSTTHTFGHDGHGSVRVLFEAAAAIAQVYTYTAYGELLAIHNGAGATVGTVGAAGLEAQSLTSQLYSGESFDARIGQQYLRARWYDATTGRFNRLDPFSGNPNDPFSFHKYGYTHANPVMGIDPSGKSLTISLGLGSTGSVGLQQAHFKTIVSPAALSILGQLSVALIFSSVVAIYAEAVAIGLADATEYLLFTIQNAVNITIQAARQALRNLRANFVPVFPVFNVLWPSIYSWRTSPAAFGPLPRVLTYMGPGWPGAVTNRGWVHATYGPAVPPLQLDEFPYASTSQGGFPLARGYSVPARENLSEGAYLSLFYRIAMKGMPGNFVVVFIP